MANLIALPVLGMDGMGFTCISNPYDVNSKMLFHYPLGA
jgi:hypothetical protein